MKKETKKAKVKEQKVTVSVDSIATSVVYRSKANRGIVIETADDADGEKGIILLRSLHLDSGVNEQAFFGNTDEIRRCLDHFDETRKKNSEHLGEVIDFEEVEKTEE